jgi:hypothetical protein
MHMIIARGLLLAKSCMLMCARPYSPLNMPSCPPPSPSSFLTCFMSMWHGFKTLFTVPLVLMTQLWTKFMSEPREESVQSIRLIPWWWRQHAPLKRLSSSTWLHSDISQKTLNFILAAVRTWNLTCMQITWHAISSSPFVAMILFACTCVAHMYEVMKKV